MYDETYRLTDRARKLTGLYTQYIPIHPAVGDIVPASLPAPLAAPHHGLTPELTAQADGFQT